MTIYSTVKDFPGIKHMPIKVVDGVQAPRAKTVHMQHIPLSCM